jgi:hypothetical protein
VDRVEQLVVRSASGTVPASAIMRSPARRQQQPETLADDRVVVGEDDRDAARLDTRCGSRW